MVIIVKTLLTVTFKDNKEKWSTKGRRVLNVFLLFPSSSVLGDAPGPRAWRPLNKLSAQFEPLLRSTWRVLPPLQTRFILGLLWSLYCLSGGWGESELCALLSLSLSWSQRKTAAMSTRKRCFFSHQAVCLWWTAVWFWLGLRCRMQFMGQNSARGGGAGLFLAEPPPPLWMVRSPMTVTLLNPSWEHQGRRPAS